MANNPQFSDGTVIAGLAAQGALANSGFLELYSGTQPTDANTAIGAQVLLATLTFGATAFGTPVAGGSPGSRTVVMTANTITGANAGASGTTTWARAYQSNGTSVVFDCSVGTAGTDIVLNTTALVFGIPVAITALTITRAET